jgi:hypothetical protein
MKTAYALAAIICGLMFIPSANAQGVCCTPAPTVTVAPTTTFYAPAPAVVAPTTTFYAPAPAIRTSCFAPAPVTTFYAPAPVTTFHAPAPVTTFYAPAPVSTVVVPVGRPGLFGWRWRRAWRWGAPVVVPY